MPISLRSHEPSHQFTHIHPVVLHVPTEQTVTQRKATRTDKFGMKRGDQIGQWRDNEHIAGHEGVPQPYGWPQAPRGFGGGVRGPGGRAGPWTGPASVSFVSKCRGGKRRGALGAAGARMRAENVSRWETAVVFFFESGWVGEPLACTGEAGTGGRHREGTCCKQAGRSHTSCRDAKIAPRRWREQPGGRRMGKKPKGKTGRACRSSHHTVRQ